jgi:phage terminase large subunit GpA-like protein
MIRAGVRLWPVNTSIGKEELYRALRLSAPDLAAGEPWPSGFCHFPEYGKEFFEQLCAEQLITHTMAGRTTNRWEKRRDRNEALDCRIYARAAAATMRMDVWQDKRWDELETALRAGAAVGGKGIGYRPQSPVPEFQPFKADEGFLE